MRGRLALVCLSMVAVLFGIGAPGMVMEVTAGTPISSCGPIVESGSYELTQSLVSYGGDCIMVQVEFVTIDLKGYAISGAAGSWGTAIVGWGRGLTIRDGTIYNFQTGIRVGEGAVVERVRLVSNVVGVEAGGFPGGSVLVKDSVFNDNSSWGVSMGAGTVTGSVFNRNAVGIVTSFGGTIANNTLSQNSVGLETRGGGASIQNNTVTDSWNMGVNVTCPANIIGNTVTGGSSPFSVQGPVWECNFEHNLVTTYR